MLETRVTAKPASAVIEVLRIRRTRTSVLPGSEVTGRPPREESLHRFDPKRTITLAAALLLLTAGGCRSRSDLPITPQEPPSNGKQQSPARNAPARAAASAPVTLGEAPLCEASAAMVAPWDSSLILVADNEERRSLFGFTAQEGVLVDQRTLSLPKGSPGDMEALARVGDRVLAVGSFSRNKRCEVKKNRARLLLVEKGETSDRLREVRTIDGGGVLASLGDADKCLVTLFTQPAPEGAQSVCAALSAAETEAARGGACDTLNIEGAVGVSGEPDRVWLGLRSPLVDGKAILLRLTEDLDEARFDAVALIDLGGRTVRALERREGEVWGIAGPMADSEQGFQLFSLPATRLAPGARVDGVAVRGALPSSSEGLVFVGDRLHVVIDGDKGSGDACKKPARQMVAQPAGQ